MATTLLLERQRQLTRKKAFLLAIEQNSDKIANVLGVTSIVGGVGSVAALLVTFCPMITPLVVASGIVSLFSAVIATEEINRKK